MPAVQVKPYRLVVCVVARFGLWVQPGDVIAVRSGRSILPMFMSSCDADDVAVVVYLSRADGALQRHALDAEMAVLAVVPPPAPNQPFSDLGLLARHGTPLQPAAAPRHPAPRGPDPAG